MAPCLKELLPFVYEKSSIDKSLLSKMNSFDYNSMKLGHIVKYHNVFEVSEWPISHHAFRSCCPLLMTIPYLYQFGNRGGGASLSHGHISCSVVRLLDF